MCRRHVKKVHKVELPVLEEHFEKLLINKDEMDPADIPDSEQTAAQIV